MLSVHLTINDLETDSDGFVRSSTSALNYIVTIVDSLPYAHIADYPDECISSFLVPKPTPFNRSLHVIVI